MQISKEQRSEFKELIRRLKVMNPRISVLKVQDALKKRNPPIHLSRVYVNDLLKEIAKENAERYKNVTIDLVLSSFQDEVEELKGRLWEIINDRNSNYSEKINAIRELRNSSRDVFEKMFDAGVFDRNIGKIMINNLSEEEKDLIAQAIKMDYGNKQDEQG